MTPELEAAYADLAAVARDLRERTIVREFINGELLMLQLFEITQPDRKPELLARLRTALARVDKAERGTTCQTFRGQKFITESEAANMDCPFPPEADKEAT